MDGKITIHTVSLLPIEIAEKEYKYLIKYIRKNAEEIIDKRTEEKLEEKPKEEIEEITEEYFPKEPEEKDNRISRIATLPELEIVKRKGNEPQTEESRIYSTTTEIDGVEMKTSICVARELKTTDIDIDKDILKIVGPIKRLREGLDKFIGTIAPSNELDNEPYLYNGVLFDLGCHKKRWSQSKPAFHYTFCIISCSKSDEEKAKEIAYYLNNSILEIKSEDSRLPDSDNATIPKAFENRIDPRLDLYLLANPSTFTILSVGIDDDDNDDDNYDIPKSATYAAVRIQSIRNLCYFYSTSGLEDISSYNGQRMLNFAENILTHPISATRDNLSNRILKSLIEPTGIQEQVKSLEGQIASKKASEEAARERRTNIILTLIATAFALYQTDEVPNIIAFIVFLILLLVMIPTIGKMISLVWKRRWKKKFLKAFSKFSKAPL